MLRKNIYLLNLGNTTELLGYFTIKMYDTCKIRCDSFNLQIYFAKNRAIR